ncbi:hypothetical protein D3C78_19060 [compost metagenome]
MKHVLLVAVAVIILTLSFIGLRHTPVMIWSITFVVLSYTIYLFERIRYLLSNKTYKTSIKFTLFVGFVLTSVYYGIEHISEIYRFICMAGLGLLMAYLMEVYPQNENTSIL